MNPTISRRTLAKGAAWSAPVVLGASPVHAASYSDYCPSDDELNAGICSAKFASAWQVIGAKTYSTTAGGLLNATTAMNFGTKWQCHNRGLVNWKMYNRVAHYTLPRPKIVFRDGTTYEGTTTLGSDQGGGAQVGFLFSLSVYWEGPKRSNRKDWAGAQVSVPMKLFYTSPNGTLRNCQLVMKYEMPTTYSMLVKPMGNPRFELYP